MQVVFLVAVVAFAAVCNAQNHPLTNCTIDSDCNDDCKPSTGVCSPPQNHCHCHDKEVSCKKDDDCKDSCEPLKGCCHNHDHCHCEEKCDHLH